MPEPASACPRCGYDQSGVIASWADCCPLNGVCSECGLPFRWRDILNENYRREVRLFENASLRLMRSFFATLLRSLAPWRLWRWVRMENPINPRRLCLFVVLGTLLIHLLAAAAPTCVAAFDHLPVSLPRPSTWPGSRTEWLIRRAGVALWPLCDDEGGYSLRQFAVWLHPLALLAALVVVLMPATYLLLPATFRRARVRRAHLVRVAAYSLPLVVLIWGLPLLGLTMVVLPERVVPRNWWPCRPRNAIEAIVENRWRFLVIAIALAQAVWWWRAAAHYLKIPHAPGVAAAMTILAVALATLAILLIPGGGPWLAFGL